jgi:DNA-binding transcriptional LysR family regulator
MPTTRQLECALAIEKHKHFGHAANAIGITTSGLTQALQRLEVHYGCQIFTRGRGGVSVTHIGQLVLDGVRSIVEREAALKRQIKLISNLDIGHLRVGIDPLLANTLMAPALSLMLKAYPSLNFSMVTGDWKLLHDQIERRDLDMIISYRQKSILSSDLTVIQESLTGIKVFCAKNHPLTQKKSRKLADYFEYPVIGVWQPDWYLEWAEQQLQKESPNVKIKKDYYLYADDVATLITIVKSSHAVVALCESDVQDELLAGNLVEVNPESWPTHVPIAIVTLGDKHSPVAAKALISALRQIVATLSSESRALRGSNTKG